MKLCIQWTSHSMNASHLMNKPFDEQAIRWTSHSMNKPFDEQAIRWTSHSMNKPFDEQAIRWTSHLLKSCFDEKLLWWKGTPPEMLIKTKHSSLSQKNFKLSFALCFSGNDTFRGGDYCIFFQVKIQFSFNVSFLNSGCLLKA